VFLVGLLIVFLATSSLEFSAKRFLVTYSKETLINEWCIPWARQFKRKRACGKVDIVVEEYQLDYELYELQVDCERPPSFVDY
jgi:hypothetical protein